jgi:SNF2 family DNA or RNA helicase
VLEITYDILKKLNDKVVIVSAWTSALNIIGDYLVADGIPYTEITGETPIALRIQREIEFNSKNSHEKVFLKQFEFIEIFVFYIY